MKEGYKKTEVGFIPNEWEVKTTGEIFEFTGGLSISREKLGEEGVNYLHYGDIHKRNENFIDLEVDDKWMPKLNEEYENIKEGVKLETGDVVFADASEDYEGIGKSVAIFNYDNKPFVAGLHTIVGKDKNKVLDEQYKRYCFSTENIRKQFRILATGTSVYGISRENIKKIRLLNPPLKEQQKIAEILSTVDSQIDDTDKIIEKTKELKKGLMQRLLTKGIGHKEFKMTEVGEIPVEWEIRQLGEICEFRQGFQIPRTEQITEFKEGYIRYLYITDFFSDENKLFVKNDEKYYRIQKNDVTIANTGNTCGKPFKGAEGVLSNNMFKIFNDTNVLLTNYLWHYLNSSMYWNQLYKYFNTAGQPHVGHKNMSQLFITLPSHLEQQKIAQILSSVDTQIEEYENKKSKLEELKKALMQQLLTGKIRVV